MSDTIIAPSRDSAVPVPPPAPPSLRRRAIRGTTWIIASTPITYALRLGSSLILTRLLFPEAFGLMATIGAIASAVEMCSDFGLCQAVVQHARGDTCRYLCSAWSLMLVRGLGLALVVAGLAWPSAIFFEHSILFPTILVMSLSSVVRGLANPRMMCWVRDLAQGRLVLLGLATETVRIAATVALAITLRSIWALVIGSLISEGARVAGSYFLDPVRPRWCWDRSVLRELVGFGRFIFVSNVLGFLALRLDAVCVAKFLGMERAGVYYIGTTIAAMLTGVFAQFSGSILFPAMSRYQDHADLLRKRTTDIACLVVLIVLPAAMVVVANADTLLMLLYDTRYHDAAGALSWLLVAACLGLLGDTLNAPLMATGRPYLATLGTLARLVGFIVLAPWLGATYGVQGYAAAVAGSSMVFMLFMLLVCQRNGHLALRRFGSALVFPALFGAILLAFCLVVVHAAPAAPGRLLVLALTGGFLAGLWLWRRKPLMQLVSS